MTLLWIVKCFSASKQCYFFLLTLHHIFLVSSMSTHFLLSTSGPRNTLSRNTIQYIPTLRKFNSKFENSVPRIVIIIQLEQALS